MSLTETADVVIAGGGVVGASVAYHLVAEGRAGVPRGGRPGRVVVLERDPTYERASFALATGGFRLQFSHPANIAMAKRSAEVYEAFADLLAVEGTPGDCGLRQVGYLFLADDRIGPALLRRMEANLDAGVHVERLDQTAILLRVPELDLGGIRFAVFGPRDGTVDPRAIQASFMRAARHLGAEWLDDEATGVELEGSRIAAVTTRGGRRLATRVLVNACGAWAARLGRLAGAEVPVEPVRRQLYVVEPGEPLGEAIPMVVDPTGVHFRADAGGTLRIGEGADGGVPAADLLPADPALPLPITSGPWPYDAGRFTAQVMPVLGRRVPALARRLQLLRGWAGLYEVSPDHNAILGEHPGRPGFVLANGFSGHGVIMAPAAGIAIGEWIRLGRYDTVDATPFRLSRFAEGRPIVEEAVL